uniref:Uncharacterized protein n=1 Tax=Arion vulgaris TaxID=1028688 RepID=A0A0B7BW74_9EUPU
MLECQGCLKSARHTTKVSKPLYNCRVHLRSVSDTSDVLWTPESVRDNILFN